VLLDSRIQFRFSDPSRYAHNQKVLNMQRELLFKEGLAQLLSKLLSDDKS